MDLYDLRVCSHRNFTRDFTLRLLFENARLKFLLNKLIDADEAREECDAWV